MLKDDFYKQGQPAGLYPPKSVRTVPGVGEIIKKGSSDLISFDAFNLQDFPYSYKYYRFQLDILFVLIIRT
jgi:hypothetical protein